ncbi:MAG: RNA polymerase sigma factor [Anaerolineae bacterium]|jgi:RNA polymerase sigma-70 factor (ECF subfamily)|nr:RNA polymerase sigma factor [Anaerolineae bacterium]
MPDPELTPSDGELISRLQQAELEALGLLFERYRTRVYRTALAIVRDPAVAEDILQDCFLKVYANAHRIDTSRPLVPWLYRVTVNLSYTWLSRGQARRTSLDNVIDRLTSPMRQAPDRVAEQVEMRHSVRQAIGALSIDQRVTVVLYYLNGLSIQDIAEILDLPVGTVKSRLYYARENLRSKLGPNMVWLPEVAHGYI